MKKNAEIGPLQLLVFAFDEPNFTGKIADEIKKLNDKKMLRLIDGLAIQKDQNGNVTSLETSQLSFEEAAEYGAIIGGLIGIGSGSEEIAEANAYAMAARFQDRYEFGLDAEDVKDMAENIPNDSAALLLLVEHLWAIPLRDAMREANGMLIAQDFLSPELLVSIGQSIYTEAVT